MGLMDMLRGNATAADPAKIQQELQPILIQGESVQRAFVFVRDQVVFTDRRMIFVNKQGVTGKKVDWRSIPYSKITSFSAETAGFMDTDAELRVWVGSAQEPIKIEISRGVPIQEIYQVISWYVLR
ncbi:PH domain-containing protein [Candidatus Sumerlaeota bacterium]|nr:PH domain-containing protein [Candidatus Sumerlaeota bacterium]